MKTWLLAFMAALVFNSCLPVPFDLEISQAAATAQKMTLDTPSPVSAGEWSGQQDTQFVLLPSVAAAGGFDYSAGIVGEINGVNVNIVGITGGSTFGSTGLVATNPDPNAPSFAAWPVKLGLSGIGIEFNAVTPSSSPYVQFVGNASNQTLSAVPGTLLSLDSTAAAVLGASIQSMPASLAYDMLHLLSVDATGTSFREVSWQASNAGLSLQNPFRSLGSFFSLAFIPAGTTRVMYYYDDNQSADPSRLPNRSVGNWFANGAWQTWTWWETPSTGSGTFVSKQLPIAHRIDALLSNGQLLSTEGGTGRLYDRDGNLLATFPLGNLVFIGEQYVGGVARSYFSEALVYEKTLHFNVYWMATDQLATLGS